MASDGEDWLWDIEEAPAEEEEARNAEPRRGRGRPRKAPLEAAPPAAQAAANALALFLRPIGTVEQKALREAVLREHPKIDEETPKFVDHCLGPFPRGCVPQRWEAAQLGLRRQELFPMVKELGAAVFQGSRLIMGSLLSHLLRRSDMREISMLSTTVHTSYDETPLPFRAEFFPSQPPKSQARTDAKKQLQTCKVMQTALSLVIVFEETASQRICSCHIPLTAPLQLADSMSGEVIAALSEKSCVVPFLPQIRERCAINFECVACDRASANIKAEAILRQKNFPTVRLTLPCAIHMVSTIQGTTFRSVDTTVSGLIAFALAQKPGGAVGALRAALEYVLKQSVQIVHGHPPGPETLQMQARDDLWRLCLGDSATGQRRLKVLQVPMGPLLWGGEQTE